MENQKTLQALTAFREQLAADMMSGALDYTVASTMNGNYVDVTAKLGDFEVRMAINVKGYICYFTEFIKGMFGDREKEFCDKVWAQFAANRRANAVRRKGELEKEIEKLDAIIEEGAA